MLTTTIVEQLILAGAHEVLSRSAWSTFNDPPALDKAAAAGDLIAYVNARRERDRAYGVVVGMGLPAAIGFLLTKTMPVSPDVF